MLPRFPAVPPGVGSASNPRSSAPNRLAPESETTGNAPVRDNLSGRPVGTEGAGARENRTVKAAPHH